MLKTLAHLVFSTQNMSSKLFISFQHMLGAVLRFYYHLQSLDHLQKMMKTGSFIISICMSCPKVCAKDVLLIFHSRFVDRDMVMQFCGGGVGHKAIRKATDSFLRDQDLLDLVPQQAPIEGDVDGRLVLGRMQMMKRTWPT